MQQVTDTMISEALAVGYVPQHSFPRLTRDEVNAALAGGTTYAAIVAAESGKLWASREVDAAIASFNGGVVAEFQWQPWESDNYPTIQTLGGTQ